MVIDVSQSVEMDHPRALEFLRADCKNVNDFFGDRGRSTDLEPLSTRALFDLVTHDDDPFQTDDDVDASIQRALAAHQARPPSDVAHDDAVFMATYLPRTLNELGAGLACEREQAELRSGNRELAFEKAVASLLGGSRPADEGDREEGEEEDEQEEEDDEDEDEEVSAAGRLPTDPAQRALAKQKKREATKATKEARAEKRKTKLKKHLKKKAISRAKRRS